MPNYFPYRFNGFAVHLLDEQAERIPARGGVFSHETKKNSWDKEASHKTRPTITFNADFPNNEKPRIIAIVETTLGLHGMDTETRIYMAGIPLDWDSGYNNNDTMETMQTPTSEMEDPTTL